MAQFAGNATGADSTKDQPISWDDEKIVECAQRILNKQEEERKAKRLEAESKIDKEEVFRYRCRSRLGEEALHKGVIFDDYLKSHQAEWDKCTKCFSAIRNIPISFLLKNFAFEKLRL